MTAGLDDPTAEADLVRRLGAVDTSSLADAGKTLRVLPPTIRLVAPGRRMVGRAVTAVAAGDLASVIAALDVGGEGDVLVITDGGEHAVAGELFATEAIRRGITGLVVDGLVRDTATLAELPLAVYARGWSPRAAPAVGDPVIDVPVVIDAVGITPGDLLVGDDDGVVIGSVADFAAAIDGAEAIQVREAALRAAVAAGAPLLESLGLTGPA